MKAYLIEIDYGLDSIPEIVHATFDKNAANKYIAEWNKSYGYDKRIDKYGNEYYAIGEERSVEYGGVEIDYSPIGYFEIEIHDYKD